MVMGEGGGAEKENKSRTTFLRSKEGGGRAGKENKSKTILLRTVVRSGKENMPRRKKKLKKGWERGGEF